MHLSFIELTQHPMNMIVYLRLQRGLAAFVCGGLLAFSGAIMQVLLQNPLADPYILGIAGASSLGTLLLMFLGVSMDFLFFGALGGSLLSILLILLFASKHQWRTHNLLLIGVALACGFAAAISLLLMLSPSNNLHSMMFWLNGDLNEANTILYPAIILFVGLFLCICISPGINLLARGDLAAQTLGLDTKKYKIILYCLSSVLTATAVLMGGCIGFVGLIIPHISRQFVGSNHRFLLPASILMGGAFLTFADTIARSAFSPIQLPVGVITALIGVPTFIWLLQK